MEPVVEKTNQQEEKNPFGSRITVEQYMKKNHGNNKNQRFSVAERADKAGFYYFKGTSVDDEGKEKVTWGYVPHELGRKITKEEKIGDLFIVDALTEGRDEPLFMLCESREKILFTAD